jgi:hypothetical protein
MQQNTAPALAQISGDSRLLNALLLLAHRLWRFAHCFTQWAESALEQNFKFFSWFLAVLDRKLHGLEKKFFFFSFSRKKS